MGPTTQRLNHNMGLPHRGRCPDVRGLNAVQRVLPRPPRSAVHRLCRVLQRVDATDAAGGTATRQLRVPHCRCGVSVCDAPRRDAVPATGVPMGVARRVPPRPAGSVVSARHRPARSHATRAEQIRKAVELAVSVLAPRESHRVAWRWVERS